MGSAESQNEKLDKQSKQPENKTLTVSSEQAYKDHAEHKATDAGQTIAMAQQQMEKGHLTKTEIVSDFSKMHSDKPKNGATLEDGPNGNKRVSEVKYEDGKSRKFTYDEQGHLNKYTDKNGHQWERDKKDPNQWNQMDGKSHMRGQMIVGKDGEFKFVNYDKKYVSHYDANGNEKKEAQRETSSYSAQEKAELRMQGNAFANTGEPQDVNPPDPMKMSVAERDQRMHSQAMGVVDGIGQAIDGAINQITPDFLKPAEQAVSGFVGEVAHAVIGLANLVSPHRPENAIVQQAENATEQTMNQVFGPIAPTDYAGHAMRDMLIRGIGTAVTPLGTAGDIAHAVIDPIATAANYYGGAPDIGADIGRAGEYLKDPRTFGQTAAQAVMLLAPLKGLGRFGRAGAAGEAGSVAGLLEDGASQFKPKAGGAGDAFNSWRDRPWAKQAEHTVQGEVVEEAGESAAKTAAKSAPHEDIVDVEV